MAQPETGSAILPLKCRDEASAFTFAKPCLADGSTSPHRLPRRPAERPAHPHQHHRGAERGGHRAGAGGDRAASEAAARVSGGPVIPGGVLQTGRRAQKPLRAAPRAR